MFEGYRLAPFGKRIRINRTNQSDPIPSTTEPIKQEPIGLPVTQPTKRVSTKDEYIGNPPTNRFIVEVWFNSILWKFHLMKDETEALAES